MLTFISLDAIMEQCSNPLQINISEIECTNPLLVENFDLKLQNFNEILVYIVPAGVLLPIFIAYSKTDAFLFAFMISARFLVFIFFLIE